MGVRHRVADFEENFDVLLASHVLNPHTPGKTFHHFHCVEGIAAGGSAQIVNRNDVRVDQVGGYDSFRQEHFLLLLVDGRASTRFAFGVLGKLPFGVDGFESLEGDLSGEGGLFGEIDNPHPALSEFSDDFVVRISGFGGRCFLEICQLLLEECVVGFRNINSAFGFQRELPIADAQIGAFADGAIHEISCTSGWHFNQDGTFEICRMQNHHSVCTDPVCQNRKR